MEYTIEFNIEKFEFWAGAKERTENLTPKQKLALGEYIEEVFADTTPTETQINDFVWFDCDEFLENLNKTGQPLDEDALTEGNRQAYEMLNDAMQGTFIDEITDEFGENYPDEVSEIEYFEAEVNKWASEWFENNEELYQNLEEFLEYSK